MFDLLAMNEPRVLALAGLFQAATLAQQLANQGQCDPAALEASLASIFRIDAPTVVGVYGNVGGIRLGLRSLVTQLDDGSRDIGLTRMAVTLMRLERSLTRRPQVMARVREEILATQRQVDHFGLDSPQVIQRLAQVYASNLSGLSPRVMVSGLPRFLQQASVVEKVRACLLAAVRSAVLWRQVGGHQWQIIASRRQCSMLARGLLTGITLDNG